MPELILYDLPSKGRCSCWSLNVWKTRMALNYKGIDYRTEWIEYPDIEPKFKDLGLGPNEKGSRYTVPMVRFPDGRHVMHSTAIAKELEKLYPEPSLHLDYADFDKFFGHIIVFSEVTVPWWVTKMPRNVLRKESVDYFETTRAEWFEMSLEQVEKTQATDERWEKARPPATALGDMLRASGGPFFMGNTVSHADFILVGFLHCMRRADEQTFEKALDLDSALKPLYDACKKWLERDDQ